jgi:UDP-N-acetylglucosamine--N-acetylmuramyl-(pentapeptide) pyrophosphoryl-undecaprenol N-acetylglucosamine transferase
MSLRSFFFAGGGTGGHIYPALAVAEKLTELEPTANIHFFCSPRRIDERILEKTGFAFTKLPARGLSFKPVECARFWVSMVKSYQAAKKTILKNNNPLVVGVGGFVAAPACLAAHRLRIPVKLLNVDIVPGRANKIIASWADEIFVQFDDTAKYFGKNGAKIRVVGCPLRRSFENPRPNESIKQLGLDENKKTLLITGASSGSANINEAVCLLLERFSHFADRWQIVHLAGMNNYESVGRIYSKAGISHKVLPYTDDMPNLLAAADLVVGRSGAVSVAEYAVAGVPSVCMPYPYHKDRHQYLNANKLVEAGAAVIVDDSTDVNNRTERLWQVLKDLMTDNEKLHQMKEACEKIARPDAALQIAQRLLAI